MTKEEVKLLCEADDKLQWWAMVLFAEITEVASEGSAYEGDDHAVLFTVRAKMKEFPRLVVQRAMEKAKEQFEKEGEE